jgi:hypothetical protein
MNYNNRKFRPVSTTENGAVSEATVFHYLQQGNVLTCNYSGGAILQGHLIALVDDDGKIDMRYHQINLEGKLMTGFCKSVPEFMPNGKIRLHETWQWTSGDQSAGTSILEEIA